MLSGQTWQPSVELALIFGARVGALGPTQQLTALRTKERSSLALNRYLTATLVNQ